MNSLSLVEFEKKLKNWKKNFFELRRSIQHIRYLDTKEYESHRSLDYYEKRLVLEKDTYLLIYDIAEYVFSHLMITGPMFKLYLESIAQSIHKTPSVMALKKRYENNSPDTPTPKTENIKRAESVQFILRPDSFHDSTSPSTLASVGSFFKSSTSLKNIDSPTHEVVTIEKQQPVILHVKIEPEFEIKTFRSNEGMYLDTVVKYEY
jgi:hypothetical protein